MTRKIWVLVIASIFVPVILLESQVFAIDTDRRKKIVVFLNGTSLTVQQTVVALSGSTVVHTLSFIDALAIELPEIGTDAALAFLLNYTVLGVPIVEAVYDDLVVSVLPITPAPPPPQQMYDWGLAHISADVAHAKMPTVTGAGVQVAILDTGVGPHAELTIVDGYNALPGGVPNLYSDDHGHGTHIAGIIAASAHSGVGTIGGAPEADIVAVKVLDYQGKGYLSNLINGLQWVYNRKQIRLVNMSLGFSTDSPPLKTAIKKLFDQGTIMVASAGNSCSDDPGQDEGGEDAGETCDAPQTTDIKYPAHYQWVIAVTAIDINYQITDYSLVGSKVDMTASGGVRTGARILSTYHLPPFYGYGSGTSQAAAHVTGALALKLQQKSQLSLSQAQVLLCQTARNLGYQATKQGCGLIDAEKLLAAP
jgi:minor extracellular protease Epr